MQFCGSGGTYVEDDRVILCYQGDLTDKKGGAIHIMESRDDLLINWKRVSELPVITTYNDKGEENPYNAFDPCMWKEDGRYYLLSAGGGSLPHPIKLDRLDFRRMYLFSSNDLVNWEYHHPILENDTFAALGDDGACPYLLPIGDDKRLLLHFSHKSGGKYVIGRYDNEKLKLYAENGGSFNSNAWFSGVHAPSAYSDGKGAVDAIFNVNFGYASDCENQIMSLPRKMTLGEQNTLCQAPDGDYESLRYDGVTERNVLLEANKELVLDKISGSSLEIRLKADVKKKSEGRGFIPSNLFPCLELRVLRSPDLSEYTSIRFFRNRSKMNWHAYISDQACWANATESVIEVDTSTSSAGEGVAIHPTESQSFYIPNNEELDLHVFVDKSIVEVFANGKACISVRAYPFNENSIGVSVISRGSDAIISYEAWKMKGIFE